MKQIHLIPVRQILLPLMIVAGIIMCGSCTSPAVTATPTPLFTPARGGVQYNGSGDSVVEVHKTSGAALVHIAYADTTHFEVWPYNSAGNKLPMLVNVVGRYEGTRPLDFEVGQTTASFHVTARGSWAIEILPFDRIKTFTIPANLSGKGDDVVLLENVNKPVLLKIDASHARNNFIIWAYGDRATQLVNDFAPYSNTITLNMSLPNALHQMVLSIQTEGKWSIQVDLR